MNYLQRLEDEISTWRQVSIHSHRFGGREFRLGTAEIGHIHAGGVVDIPFPRSVHDVLLAEGRAELHRWAPDSGWITYRIGSEDGLKHALWLMRLSYLRYAVKTSPDPRGLLEQQSQTLHLNQKLKSLLEAFVPKTAEQSSDVSPTEVV